jgi:flavin-dependent dehydrogenase
MSGVAATIELDAAAAIRWDVVIVGAGPAGGAAALRLARRGLRVIVIDRGSLPRGKLCGCCLSTAAVAELRSLEISGGGPLTRAVPLRRIRLVAAGSEACIAASGGATVSREALDTELLAAAVAAGAEWLPWTAAVAIDERDAEEPTVVVTVRGQRGDARTARLECHRLLLATGLGDSVRLPGGSAAGPAAALAAGSRIGIGAVLDATGAAVEPGELLMAVANCGYCGIVRLEDGRIDVAAAVDRRELATASPAAALRRILREACGSGMAEAGLEGLEAAAIRATPALTRSSPVVAGAGRTVMRVGDAAGYVEPFTGEGMGWALAAARLAAESLAEDRAGGLRPAPVAAQRYARAHARCFSQRHARCRWVAAALRRPRIVGLAVRAAQRAPWLARLTVPLVTGGHAVDRPGTGGVA